MCYDKIVFISKHPQRITLCIDTDTGKACFGMTEEQVRKVIAGNLVRFRKEMGMTQLDLSERINYSDKSISKWERGDGIPDVPTLMQLAEIFGVSVNALLYPPDLLPKEPVEPENDAISVNSTESRFSWKHIFITLLSVAGVWLAAILMICLFQYLAPGIAGIWDGRILCYALTGSFIVFLIFSSLWWPRAWIFLSISGMIWAGALSVFVTFHTIHGAAIVFALAGILELPVLVCYFWRCAAEHRWLIPYPIPRQEKNKFQFK